MDTCYTYAPLDGNSEIRLLKVHDSLGTSTLHQVSIIHVETNNAPEYEAVSYVWGTPDACQSITMLDGRKLPVTVSVARALPRLIRQCQTKYLWIDQVSINQKDIKERSHQVQIMGKIYSQSKRCLVWIDPDYSLGGDMHDNLAWDEAAAKDVLSFLSLEPSNNTDNSLARQRLLRLLKHPWFSRTWVFQEFVLPREVAFIIGDFLLRAQDLEPFFRHGLHLTGHWISWFHDVLFPSDIHVSLFDQVPGLRFLCSAFIFRDLLDPVNNQTTFTGYSSVNFCDVLRSMAYSNAQDERDHVYAFLGFAPFLLRHMSVDYSRSVEETFALTFKALVKESRSLDFFGALPSQEEAGHSKLVLPTWAPNWTIKSHGRSILCQDNLFHAAGENYGLPVTDQCKHHDTQPEVWNQLRVAGKIIDMVKYKLKPYSIYQTTLHQTINIQNTKGMLPWEPATLNRFLNELRNFTDFDICNEFETKKKLLRTLFMDGAQFAALAAIDSGESLHRTGRRILGKRHGEITEQVILALLESPESPMEMDFDNFQHRSPRQAMHELCQVQYGRRVVWCGESQFALAPDSVKEGDEIALLHGSRTPVILRKRRDGNFAVVGQCYYDGAMYGELADPDDDAAEKFTLM